MIQIKNLIKNFGKFRALNDINLNFSEGQSIALIGPNGCGKTTLIKSILGLNVIEKGSIVVDGKNVRDDFQYREHIGYATNRKIP